MAAIQSLSAITIAVIVLLVFTTNAEKMFMEELDGAIEHVEGVLGQIAALRKGEIPSADAASPPVVTPTKFG